MVGSSLRLVLALLFLAVITILNSCQCSSAFSISPSLFTQRPLVGSLHTQSATPRLNLASSASSDDESQRSQPAEELPDYDNEETLLKIHLAVQPGVSTQDALQSVAKYSQSFPFAAVLPVQPLTYLPTPDDGVEIKFMRKKTELKSSIDGGIRFFVKEITVSPGGEPTTLSFDDNTDEEDDEEEEDDDDEEACAEDTSGKCVGGLEVTAKRNSVGQSIRKLTAERLVVTAYVAGITGEETKKYGTPPTEQVYVTSVFHKWM